MKKIPEESLLVSAVTLGEMQAGIEITRARDAPKAAEIEAWLEDALIAATALVRDLVIATRNTADFKPLGVYLVNPFH